MTKPLMNAFSDFVEKWHELRNTHRRNLDELDRQIAMDRKEFENDIEARKNNLLAQQRTEITELRIKTPVTTTGKQKHPPPPRPAPVTIDLTGSDDEDANQPPLNQRPSAPDHISLDTPDVTLKTVEGKPEKQTATGSPAPTWPIPTKSAKTKKVVSPSSKSKLPALNANAYQDNISPRKRKHGNFRNDDNDHSDYVLPGHKKPTSSSVSAVDEVNHTADRPSEEPSLSHSNGSSDTYDYSSWTRDRRQGDRYIRKYQVTVEDEVSNINANE
ncbi:hypothetical protein GQ44DRAFT_726117 [Phaeosphaeriaceae sp. PMI808]|nr:hypothetical protein GQ44DRAFT_726117 [Phaeosphaeriaceae sp. PMI808]